jgi:UDP-N-acetyl-alpha-D-muramoyl-L-alanyl-L-glutamate epimerase
LIPLSKALFVSHQNVVPAVFVPTDWNRFHYVSAKFDRHATAVRATLRYALSAADAQEPNGSSIDFVEEYVFHVETAAKESSTVWEARWGIAERLLTHLWLVAGLSYYKTSAAPNISVHEIPLHDDEVKLHQLLLQRGLGEFCFVNNLDPTLNPTWTYESAPTEPVIVGASLTAGPLVPVGGGKDSCVTIEALRSTGRAPTLVTVRRFPIIQDVIDASDLADVQVERILDPRIGELNTRGAMNGHVPATAIVSFAALIAAVLGGHDALVMSNERSASEGNVEYRGVSINHQWAKSDEAERAISEAIGRITSELRWFSLLRPLSELEISRRFAQQCTRYFDSFSSCNRTQRIDPARRVSRWCGECPKCQFVYLALATSLPRTAVERIWGSELFATSPLDGFRSLLGLAEWKPFECVGEHVECRVALQYVVAQPEWADHVVLGQLASEVQQVGGWPTDAEVAAVYARGADTLLPTDYRNVLQ